MFVKNIRQNNSFANISITISKTTIQHLIYFQLYNSSFFNFFFTSEKKLNIQLAKICLKKKNGTQMYAGNIQG